MTVIIDGETQGVTGVLLRHRDSGGSIQTAAPRDNGGDGSSFSPTDLCAASLGACAATIMRMKAHALGIQAHIQFRVTKEMAGGPRRISRLTTDFWIDAPGCGADVFDRIVAAGKTCPVRFSLSQNLEIVENYFAGPQGAEGL